MRKMSIGELSVLLFAIICCSGFSALMPLRIYMIVLFCVIVIFQNMNGGRIAINKTPMFIWYTLLMLFVAMGIFYSFQKVETIKFFITYIAGASLILMPTKDVFHERSLVLIDKICKIVALSIIVQIVVPNLYSNYLYFLIQGGASAKSRLAGEVSSHIYSGILGEKGEAAFLMVVAIILLLSKCAQEKRISFKNLIWLGIYFVALLLPAKRMLFAVAILICMLYMVFWNNGSKKIVAIGGFGIFGCIGYFVMSMIPSMSTLLARFTAFADDDTGNGRIYLWEHAISMFHEKPLLGYGYGTYNAYASNKGVVLTKSRIWVSQAHNIYYQMLGEIGIIGITLFLLVTLAAMLVLLRLYRRRSELEANDFVLLFVGVNLIVLTLVYGLTGNIIYYTNQIMFFFWGISISAFLYKKYIRTNKR